MNKIESFLSAKTYAVAGASTRRHKYGNKVFRALVDSGRDTYPLNPLAREVEGRQAYTHIGDLPIIPESLSIITPPSVTRKIVFDAISAGVKNIWMQPGAEEATASQAARDAGINVIDDGSCLLISINFHD